MKFGTTPLIILLALLAILIGGVRYVYIPKYYPQLLKPTQAEQLANQAALVQPSPSPEPEAYGSIATVSAQLLKTLTPRQKVAQLLALPVTVPANDKEATIASTAAEIQNEVPGFIALFGSNISALQADRVTNELKQIPIQPRMVAMQPNLTEDQRQFLKPLIAVDHEGGTVQRLKGEGMTTLPSAYEQCHMDRTEFKTLLDRTAKELAGVGIDIVFAPDLDVGVNHPILKTRLCSDNPDTIRTYALFWIEAMQLQHVIPVLKHYPGIGQTSVDLHKQSEVIDFNPVEHSIFLGLLSTYPNIGLMTTHVALTPEAGKVAVPCTISADCLANLQLPTPHLIFTDGLEMAGAQGTSKANASGSAATTDLTKQSLSELAIGAIDAGHNVIVVGKTVPMTEADQMVSDMADRYQRDPFFKQKVDQALRVIWQAKYEHWSAAGTLLEIK